MRILYILFLFFSCSNFLNLTGTTQNIESEFLESFLKNYDLAGRYTHEYHPFIRNKTAESLLTLEQSVNKAGFNLDGRLVILGYQEDAIAPYVSDFSRISIDDEVSVKTNTGRSAPARNIFGLYTGFVLKDLETMEKIWSKDPTFCHFTARPLQLFDDNAVVLQKHAFGKEFDHIMSVRDNIERSVHKENIKSVLDKLTNFWSDLYTNSSKSGSDEIVATQDILFNIDYGRALSRSSSSINKIFIGPDITYPIEVSNKQHADSTVHAQNFVKFFSNFVTPKNNQNTAYIFCSFVDGVGKSTLLNNLKNYTNFGDNINSYNRCDNSSSQEATIFKLKDKVYIVDLPAQVSHYTIKPEGSVYADIDTIKSINQQEHSEIARYIIQNKAQLISEFEATKLRATESKEPLYSHPEDSIYTYAQNSLLMNSKNDYIACVYKNRDILFSSNNINKIKILVPLSQAHSTALKTVDPEAMLFTQGLSLPMSLDSFMNNLVSKMKDSGIERVIFVDFLSMYPRTSRENIRVNFILQYLKQIYADNYDINKSFYRHLVNGEAEIYHMLHNHKDSISKTLELEAALRCSMFSMLLNKSGDSVNTLNGQKLEESLKSATEDILKKSQNNIHDISSNKIKNEHDSRHNIYSYDKIYESILCFKAEPLIEFSKIFYQLFTNKIDNTYFKNIWHGLDGELLSLKPIRNSEKGIPIYALNNGTEVTISSKIHAECRDSQILNPFINLLRAQWHGLAHSIKEWQISPDSQNFISGKVDFFVPPIVVKKGPGENIYILQKYLPEININSNNNINLNKNYKSLQENFHLINNKKTDGKLWGAYENIPHYLDWVSHTYFGIYMYGHIPSWLNPKDKSPIITLLTNECKNKINLSKNVDNILPTNDLFNVIQKTDAWKKITNKTTSGRENISITEEDPKREGLRLWTRTIATIDMIVKDCRSDIVIRKGNRQDFIAALMLLERITLPNYFNTFYTSALFNDYSKVEPIIKWDYII